MEKRNKKIFVINGSGRVGKDTFIKFVTECGVHVTNYSSVAKVKDIALSIGWNGQKTEKDRKFLSDLKQLTSEYCDMSFNEMKKQVEGFRKDPWQEVLFLQIREPEEIERAVREFCAETILVVRDSVKKIDSNPADANVLSYKHYDYIIHNDKTLEDLKRSAKEFVNLAIRKTKLFIDMDCTLFNTVKAITDLYDEDYCYYPEYKKIPWQNVKSWSFKELNCAKEKELDQYFNQKRFFDKVEMYYDAKGTIDKLSQKYEIIFVSSGCEPNLKLKDEYIKKHFPYATFIGVDLDKHSDKSHIDMSNGIFIDDILTNLTTSNAEVKICYGDYSWNNKNELNSSSDGILRANTWMTVYRIIGAGKECLKQPNEKSSFSIKKGAVRDGIQTYVLMYTHL